MQARLGMGIEKAVQVSQRLGLEGFGHGFVVLSDAAEFLYLTTDYYAPEHERAIIWNDPDLAIAWPFPGEPLLSAKDAAAPRFRDAEVYA